VSVAGKAVDEPSEDIVASAKLDSAARRGPIGRMILFLRQVMQEMRKVITPTRKELFSYTGDVLVFVGIMMALVAGFDLVFGTAVGYIWGTGPTK
jgi:preprotein translocase subunit SecE